MPAFGQIKYLFVSIMCTPIGVRDGVAGGAAAPPKRLKSRANVQHKSGKKWEIKKRKSQKAPSLLVKQRQWGNIRLTVGQYWLIVVPEKFLDP
jgi:hypothetical protein